MSKTDDGSRRPNILLIVADDLGWSDVGCFGGEIHTPNLDRLAETGIRLTDFHTASMCSPTRSMLLSGTDNHIAGLGQMAFWGDETSPWKTRPGYEGYLNSRVASLPELLQESGYYTLMSGKWHLGLTPSHSPCARGFSHWASLYMEDQTTVDSESFPERYYSIFRREGGGREAFFFFAYLPFTAPHWPLQAPADVVKKYDGVYDDGPDALREKRLQSQINLRLLPKDVEPHPVVAETKEWSSMNEEEKKWSAKTMEVFAAMVDRMDFNIGRVLSYLEESGEIDNTFILFMSDNGAEGAIIEAIPIMGDVIKQSIHKHYNNDIENLGNGDSFVWYGPRWAQASTAPSAMHKGYVTEGGIRCPAIVRHPPLFNEKNQISNAFTTVMDVLPTILDLAGIPSPGHQFRGREVVPIKGKSWIPHLSGQTPQVHDGNHVTGWEIFFHQAVRKGKFKAIFTPKPKGSEKWQLFDLERDMGEIHDLAEEKPEVLEVLVRYWMVYVAECGVFL